MILFGHVKFPVAIAFNLKSTANQTRSRCFAGTVHQNVIPFVFGALSHYTLQNHHVCGQWKCLWTCALENSNLWFSQKESIL